MSPIPKAGITSAVVLLARFSCLQQQRRTVCAEINHALVFWLLAVVWEERVGNKGRK